VGWVGKIVIPMPEALSFAESRRQKLQAKKNRDLKIELGTKVGFLEPTAAVHGAM
jgi:hypothetical protein